jgi:hypothetical protein
MNLESRVRGAFNRMTPGIGSGSDALLEAGSRGSPRSNFRVAVLKRLISRVRDSLRAVVSASFLFRSRLPYLEGLAARLSQSAEAVGTRLHFGVLDATREALAGRRRPPARKCQDRAEIGGISA